MPTATIRCAAIKSPFIWMSWTVLSGCAISTASASLMTEALKGKPVAEVEHLFHDFHEAVTGEAAPTKALGKLSILAGVKDYPSRVKCATLAWHTVRAALEKHSQPVSTE
jgi:nitrogen fixation NifU-like protein